MPHSASRQSGHLAPCPDGRGCLDIACPKLHPCTGRDCNHYKGPGGATYLCSAQFALKVARGSGVFKRPKSCKEQARLNKARYEAGRVAREAAAAAARGAAEAVKLKAANLREVDLRPCAKAAAVAAAIAEVESQIKEQEKSQHIDAINIFGASCGKSPTCYFESTRVTVKSEGEKSSLVEGGGTLPAIVKADDTAVGVTISRELGPVQPTQAFRRRLRLCIA